MTDILEKLRTEASEIRADRYPRWRSIDDTLDAAADEIEKLRKELAEQTQAHVSWKRATADVHALFDRYMNQISDESEAHGEAMNAAYTQIEELNKLKSHDS